MMMCANLHLFICLFLTIDKEGKIAVDIQELANARYYIVVTVDGLPHRIAIEVIKHCFWCSECDKKNL